MKRLTFLFAVSFGALAWALSDPTAPPPGFEWLTPALIERVETLPYVGPFAIAAFKYLAFVTAVMTVLTGSLMTLSKAASAFAWGTGFTKTAIKIDAAYKKAYPVLAYLSIFPNQPPTKK